MHGLLTFIWVVALVLVAGSFGTLGALIIARLRRTALERGDDILRAGYAKALRQLAITGERPALAVSNAHQRKVLAEEALSSAQLMRGSAKARLVALLRDMRLDRRFRRQALRGTVRDRLGAIEALALFPDAETAETLRTAEAARDLRVSLAALRVRVATGFGPDMSGLLERAAAPGAGKSAILQELIEHRAALNLPEALRLLNVSLSSAGRVLLLRAIGETGQFEALGPLKVALRHPDPEARAAAAGALGALGYSEAGPWLAHATLDGDWRVRLRAAEAIGRLGAWELAAALEPLLEDPVWWVRFRAEEALGRLGEVGLSKLADAAGALHMAARAQGAALAAGARA